MVLSFDNFIRNCLINLVDINPLEMFSKKIIIEKSNFKISSRIINYSSFRPFVITNFVKFAKQLKA